MRIVERGETAFPELRRPRLVECPVTSIRSPGVISIGDAMHWHYPLALAAPLGCLLAFLGLGIVAGTVRMVSRTSARPR